MRVEEQRIQCIPVGARFQGLTNDLKDDVLRAFCRSRHECNVGLAVELVIVEKARAMAAMIRPAGILTRCAAAPGKGRHATPQLMLDARRYVANRE
jgi:hypothetical protein